MLRLLLALVVSCWALPAYADDAWSVPTGCPDRARAEARLRALHTDPAWLSPEHARVFIAPAPAGGLRAQLVLHGKERRTFYDAACEPLAEAVLLVLSVAFEGARPARTERAASERASAPHAHPRPHVRLALAPLARVDGGSLPGRGLAFGGALRLYVGRTTLELEGSYYVPRTRARSELRVELGLATGALRACQRVAEGTRWALAPCVALELGQARGRQQYEGRALWGSALAGLALEVGPFGNVRPALDVELGLPFRRPSFELDDGSALFQARGWVLRGTLRLAIDLLPARGSTL